MSLEPTEKIYDVAIIGGGITGIGIFRDLSLHGISSVIIEKNEFCEDTSAKSSKMLHGGIRYLEQLDFTLVRDALQEKSVWMNLTPKQAYEKMFYLPLFKDSKHSPLLIRMGMFLYSKILSRNITKGGYVNSKKLKKIMPSLKKEKLRGAGFYTDAIMDDEELGKVCLKDALKLQKGRALNFTEVLSVTKKDELYQLEVKSSTETKTLRARFVVMAVGPYTDQVAQKLIGPSWENIMVPSKGIHLWLKHEAIKLKEAVVLVTKDDRVVFVIPQEKGILLGTTDTFIEPDFKDVEPNQEEIDYLLTEVNEYFPDAKVTSDSIISSYAGVRPLVKDTSAITASDVSRHHQIVRPDSHFFVIAGGKYTTFRLMAQDVVRPISNLLGVQYSSAKSLREISVE